MWAALSTWLDDHESDLTFDGTLEPAADLPGRLGEVLATVRLVAEGVKATRDDVEVVDRNSWSFVAGRLPTLVEFEEFSLAELTYRLDDGARPGVRLAMRRDDGDVLVEVVAFADVEHWRVDFDGRKLSDVLLTLAVTSASVEVRSAAPSTSAPSWARALAAAVVAQLPSGVRA